MKNYKFEVDEHTILIDIADDITKIYEYIIKHPRIDVYIVEKTNRFKPLNKTFFLWTDFQEYMEQFLNSLTIRNSNEKSRIENEVVQIKKNLMEIIHQQSA